MDRHFAPHLVAPADIGLLGLGKDELDEMNEEDLTLALSGTEPEAYQRYQDRRIALVKLKEMKAEREQTKTNFDEGKGCFRRRNK